MIEIDLRLGLGEDDDDRYEGILAMRERARIGSADVHSRHLGGLLGV